MPGCDTRRINAVSASQTRAGSRWAVATLAAVLVGVVFLASWAAGGRPMPDSGDGTPVWLEPLVSMIAYGVAGAILIDRRPDLPFGWLLAGAAVLVVVQALVLPPAYAAAISGDRSALVRWGLTTTTFAFAPIAAQGLINVRFPSGRPATSWGRLLEKIIIVTTALVFLGGLFGGTGPRDAAGHQAAPNPLTGGTVVGRIADGLTVLAPVVVLLGLVAGLGVVIRFARADGVTRQQLKWRAVGVVVALALFPLAVTDRLPSITSSLDPVVFVLTLVVPVLLYRLWAIDTILRRSLVYGTVTAALILGFALLSAVGARIVSRQVAAPVAAVIVAVSFVPLRDRSQRMVDRLFYGGRRDPYRTLRDLGRRLNAVSGGEAIDSFTHVVATALRLPYVAVERPDGRSVAARGVPAGRVDRWPLTYEGQVEGFLLASARRGEDGFEDRDRELLADIAGQLALALHTRTLNDELLRSRQRLVTAREEERRRLRRELHDGLGPVLTAIGLTLDAARVQLDNDPAAGRHRLDEAKDATVHALADLRKVVHGLRPPALDDLGLAGALRSQADRLDGRSRLRITVDADDLPDLPAAVEVAAYRTAVEAMTNAVRHSNGQRCRVRLSVTGPELVLDVRDDGTADGPWLPGVGVMAMRERAAELGGHCHAGPGRDGGGVTAHFPLPEAP